MSNHHLFLAVAAGAMFLVGCASTDPAPSGAHIQGPTPAPSPVDSPEIPPLPGLNGAEAEAPLPLPTPVTSTTGS